MQRTSQLHADSSGTLKNDRNSFREMRSPPEHAVERRQLTALFCDLVNSTSLFSTLDPEDVRDILHSYASLCAARIEAAGGIFAQFQGDAVLGYFGYIEGSENGAEQALRAALELTDAVTQMQVAEGRQLHVRIGIATGMAIVGGRNAAAMTPEPSVVGEAVHIASRLQTMARADDIVIDDDTKAITGNLFIYQDLGDTALRGIPRPVRAWKVLRARRIISQLRMHRSPVLVEFVGREVELPALRQSWEMAKRNQGHCIYLVGEAGIGKSRLVNAFRHAIKAERHIWLEGGGAQHYSNTPLAPISRMIRQILDPFGRADVAELNRRLTTALAEIAPEFADAPVAISEAMGWQPSETPAPIPIASDKKRRRTFAILCRWLCVAARSLPVVVALEDIHWFDPSSLELLTGSLEEIRSFPILIICTMRPNPRLQSLRDGRSDIVELRPMADEDLRRIVRHVGGHRDILLENQVATVVQRAGGVPLFAIELARLIAGRHSQTATRHIPSTLSGLLQSRLDQLGYAKRVAQVAAVTGDEVARSTLEILSGVGPGALNVNLAVLVDHGVLRERKTSNDSVYSFTHALLSDAAYNTLPKNERRRLHRRAAAAISASVPDGALFRPEIIAHHWTSAADWDEAVGAWQQAGDLARARRGFVEAERAYENAISALTNLSPSPTRDARELMLQSLLADIGEDNPRLFGTEDNRDNGTGTRTRRSELRS